MLCSSLTHHVHGFCLPTEEPPAGYRRLTQVHSKLVVVDDGKKSWDELKSTKADGLITKNPGTVIAIQTADCIPALFSGGDASGKPVIAAVHAGWRGVVSGILIEAVAELKQVGVDPGSLSVALGPSIGPCCFEVSAEIAPQFFPGVLNTPGKSQNPDAQAKPTDKDSRWIDLALLAQMQLMSVGVSAKSIENLGVCTYCSKEGFASYRRNTHLKNQGLIDGSQSVTTRQWSFIKL